MANTDTRFTTATVGKTAKGAYAYLLEGNLTRQSELQETKKGRPAARNSIGTGRSAMATLAFAEGRFDANESYDDNQFFSLVAYDDVAKRLSELPKGTHIAVSGRMSEETYTKDDVERKTVQVVVSEFSVLENKAHKYEFAPNTVPVTGVYTGKDGNDVEENLATQVAGNIFSVDELGTTSNGQPCLHFSMFAQEPAEMMLDKVLTGKAEGEYDEKKTIFRVTVFGKQAESLAKFLRKNMKVVVCGNVSENEYKGERRAQMVLKGLVVAQWPKDDAVEDEDDMPEDPAQNDGDAPVDGDGSFEPMDDEDDDELPF